MSATAGQSGRERRSEVLLIVAAFLAVAIGLWVVVRIVLTVTPQVQQTLHHGAGLAESLSVINREASTLRSAPLDTLARMRPTVIEAQEHLAALGPARSLVTRAAGIASSWPLVGSTARDAPSLFDFLDAGLATAREATELGDLATGVLADPSPGQRLAVELPVLRVRLDALSGRLGEAQAARQRLELKEWPLTDLQPALRQWDESVPEVNRLLVQADEAVTVLPVILGTGRPFRWLIMAQNNDELRATGGFMSMVGSLVVENGKPGAAEFEKVYLAEGMTATGQESDLPGPRLTPPLPFSRYMGLDRWLLRDANWSPDFPTSAERAAWFWTMLKGKGVDGVVAFNERGLEAVLAALGPLTLADGTRVGSDNVKALLLDSGFEGTAAPEWWASQSGISTQFGEAMVDRVSGLRLEEIEALLAAVQPAFERGDLLITSRDPVLSPILRRMGVDGALEPGADDFLYFIEQNVSFSKASQSIRHEIRYDAVLAPSGAASSARVSLAARNAFTELDRLPGYPASYYRGIRIDRETGVTTTAEGYYGGFGQLFLPASARITATSGFDDGPFESRESGLVVVAGYCGMMPGEDCQAEVAYRPGVTPSVPGRFALRVPVQPGAPPRQVVVSVSLPEGWGAEAVAGPGTVVVDERSVTWTATPDRDATFELQLVKQPH